MSIALLQQNGDLVCRIFMRSGKLACTRAVSGAFDDAIRVDLLTRAPLDALVTLGLREEANALAADALDWRWLSRSEFAAALEADILRKEYV